MRKYKVMMSEVRYGSVVVEAVCEGEAELVAEQEWKSDRVEWHDRELTDLTTEEAVKHNYKDGRKMRRINHFREFTKMI